MGNNNYYKKTITAPEYKTHNEETVRIYDRIFKVSDMYSISENDTYTFVPFTLFITDDIFKLLSNKQDYTMNHDDQGYHYKKEITNDEYEKFKQVSVHTDNGKLLVEQIYKQNIFN